MAIEATESDGGKHDPKGTAWKSKGGTFALDARATLRSHLIACGREPEIWDEDARLIHIKWMTKRSEGGYQS